MYYFDYAATTPVDKTVCDAMTQILTQTYGNPSSLHPLGQEAKVILNQARRQVASSIGAKPSEIYFTSSGTEANNWVLQGICKGLDKKHVVISAFEHPSLLNTALELERLNKIDLTLVKPNAKGEIETEAVNLAIREDTALISIMMTNNEIGYTQDIKTLAQAFRSKNILFHTDAIQSFGNTEIDVKDLDVDFLSLSAHKIYGPKGIGALYIKQGTFLAPLLYGGDQEHKKRAGTENLAAIHAFAKACEIKEKRKLEEDVIHDYNLKIRNCLLNIPTVEILSHEDCSDNIIGFRHKELNSEVILTRLSMKKICISAGSACHAGSLDPSRTMLAMGFGEEESRRFIRISLSHQTKSEEIEYLTKVLQTIL